MECDADPPSEHREHRPVETARVGHQPDAVQEEIDQNEGEQVGLESVTGKADAARPNVTGEAPTDPLGRAHPADRDVVDDLPKGVQDACIVRRRDSHGTIWAGLKRYLENIQPSQNTSGNR
jgi:hypothetical protein